MLPKEKKGYIRISKKVKIKKKKLSRRRIRRHLPFPNFFFSFFRVVEQAEGPPERVPLAVVAVSNSNRKLGGPV